MSAPINKKLPELTLDELKIVLKKSTYRGYNVNSLANSLAKNGVDKLAYDKLKNQVYILNDNGKITNKVKLDKIEGGKHSWSLTRFFKMHVCSCCFDQNAYDTRMDTLARELYNRLLNTQVSDTDSESEVQVQSSETSEQQSVQSEVQDQADGSVLTKKDFALMKTILEKQTRETDVDIYEKGNDFPKASLTVSFDKGSQSIAIKDYTVNSKTLEFKLGTPVTCFVDGQQTDLDKIPADRAEWLMGAFKAAIELSSNYESKNKKIEINVLKRGVEKNPADHLNKLSDALKEASKTKKHPRLNVVLLKENLTKGDGLDNGGISRDYLNSLFASLVEDSSVLFKAQKPSKLFMPVATQQGVASDDASTLFPGLTPMEKRSLNEMGRVMMFCYNSKPNTADIKNNAYAIGQHFDDLLFEVALTLSADEAKANFEELSVNTKTDMAKRIFEKFLMSDPKNIRDKVEDTKKHIAEKVALFDLFNWNGGAFDGYDLNAAGQFAPDFINEDDGYSIDMDLVNAKPQTFVNAVREKLLAETFGTSTVSELVAPIHAIAQGLKAACNSDYEWLLITGVTARDFNNKIQGSLNRNAIADSFQVITKFNDNDGYEKNIPISEINEMNKKTQWMKDWIQNPKTKDEDIRKFLVYTTGSNSLPNDQEITIQRQAKPYNPVPQAVTCKPALIMAPQSCGHEEVNDMDQDAFLKMLREQILNDTSFEINQD